MGKEYLKSTAGARLHQYLQGFAARDLRRPVVLYSPFADLNVEKNQALDRKSGPGHKGVIQVPITDQGAAVYELSLIRTVNGDAGLEKFIAMYFVRPTPGQYQAIRLYEPTYRLQRSSWIRRHALKSPGRDRHVLNANQGALIHYMCYRVMRDYHSGSRRPGIADSHGGRQSR